MKPFKNIYSKQTKVMFVLFIFSCIIGSLPIVLKWDLMSIGFGIMFLSLVFGLTFLITTINFGVKSHRIKNLLLDNPVMGSYVFDSATQEAYIKELSEGVGMTKIAGIFLAGIFWVIGIVVFMTDPDELVIFLVIMGVVGLLMVMVAFLSAYFQRRKIKKLDGEVVFARHAIRVAGDEFIFDQHFIKFVSLTYDGQTCILTVNRPYGKGFHRRDIQTVIPVSLGAEAFVYSVIPCYPFRTI